MLILKGIVHEEIKREKFFVCLFQGERENTGKVKILWNLVDIAISIDHIYFSPNSWTVTIPKKAKTKISTDVVQS